ncbi:MAE_28990/MAE_18760 family HEPN-like nuclease [Spirillospora sp. NPDC048819]|uniref:MAE_28990/MAE_18760 family HEPN-like nuclease n=1 Tax=Spirillospora sp. NPDC048819 TaxID=3155268 RepID=UPI0033FDCA02
MAIHDALTLEVQAQGERLLRRCDDLKKFLALVRLSPDSKQSTRWESEARDARALAVVCTMAELEAFTKFLIQETHRELNDSGLTVSSLRASLRQLAAHTTFESLRDLSDHSKLWERRKYATTLELCRDPIDLPLERKHAQPPLDGRTLRPEHFNRIWEIYGLSGEAFPVAAWSASLQKLALFRNDVAHGNISYMEVFQQAGRSVSDVERYVNDINEFVIYLATSWVDYLEAQDYLTFRISTKN